MPCWLADRGQTLDRESVRVRLLSSLTRRLGNAMRASQKSKRKGKGEPDVRLCVLDTVDGQAQPGQYGCHHCRLGCSSARPTGCQASLRTCCILSARRRPTCHMSRRMACQRVARCQAAICPVLGVKPTCHGRCSIDANDPEQTYLLQRTFGKGFRLEPGKTLR